MINRNNAIAGLLLMGVMLGGSAAHAAWWQSSPNSDQAQRRAQEQLSEASNMQVGMPSVTRFAKKRAMKDIIEMSDQMIPTYTYLTDMNGHVGDLLCMSLGYPIDGAEQYTNPSKTVEGNGNGEFTTIPQADPDGLFSPGASEGTWILCKDPTPGSSKVLPVRSEPRVITSPFKLK